jgi:hypothetical protein
MSLLKICIGNRLWRQKIILSFFKASKHLLKAVIFPLNHHMRALRRPYSPNPRHLSPKHRDLRDLKPLKIRDIVIELKLKVQQSKKKLICKE